MCTARDLLAHRSGLPAFTGDNLEALGFSRAEVMQRIRYLESPYSFRERAGYSNPGIFVAGMLAAKVGGASYEELIARRLFEPLGMFKSGVSFRDHDTKANVADAHMLNPDGTTKMVKWDNSDILGPAGEITSTANDLAHFAQMQLNDGRFNGKQIVSAESIHQMHKPAMVEEPSFAEMAPIDADSGFSYGLGWGVYHYKGHKILEKSGARMGMRSTVVLIPDKKLGFVVLCNQNLTVLPEAVRAYLMESMVERSGEDLQAKIRAANESIQKMFCLKQDTEVHCARSKDESRQKEWVLDAEIGAIAFAVGESDRNGNLA
jgi:CubicO group peptidase (beta-lactamase class C family)